VPKTCKKSSFAAMAQEHQEHQEYIQNKVNPILENLVTQLLLERPENLAPFMIKWLSEHSTTPAAAAITENVNELNTLKAELEALQNEVSTLESDAARGAQGGGTRESPAPGANDEDDEDEDDDDDDEEMAPPPPASYYKKERTSVSAEAYGQWNQKKAFTPPQHPKNDEQKLRIKGVLEQSFLFSCLDQNDLDVIILAMTELVCTASQRIIQQGDDGDCLFVVEAGSVDCFKKQPDGTEKLVKQCNVGDAFGELALLYNCPRAASVVAQDKSVLWSLDRETFNHIVKDAAAKRRERYEQFLKGVPILESMEAYERTQMCDALQSEKHPKGKVIVQQGDPGDKFYIMESGECVVTKSYVKGQAPQEVMQYKGGDYFGELALLENEPRAATVTAISDCQVLTLNRRTFKHLLGSLSEMLKRNTSRYN